MTHTYRALALAASLTVATPALAGELLHWQNNSLSYLYGHDYKVDPGIQQTVTFEHASGWRFGDLFFFTDLIHYNGGQNGAGDSRTFYGELSPRLSLGKVFDMPLSIGPISDVLLATTYEFGEDDVESYLIGPGFDLAVPGFNYFTLNFYRRQTEGPRPGDGVWQITPAWSYSIPLGRSNLLIDGYLDWVVDNDQNARGTYHANLHINPQIKYDLGKALNWGEKRVYVGAEYSYWKNKYGIADSANLDTNQNTASLLLKVHF